MMREKAMTEACAVGPKEVVAAYQKTGLEAVQGYYFVYDGPENACCGLSAVVLARTPESDWQMTIPLLLDGKLEQYFPDVDQWWVAGFIRGFDGSNTVPPDAASGFSDEDFWAGVRCGIASWDAVFDAAATGDISLADGYDDEGESEEEESEEEDD
jgi:hypothetical protein